jgi:predicted exporter
VQTDRGQRLLAWGAVLAALLVLIAWRLELSYDLGLFLPAPVTDEQRILVERLGESPGSRFILIAVPDDPDRLPGLVERLAALPGIDRVLSDLAPPLDRPPDPLWSYRYLLADMDWSSEGLEAALSERLGELALGGDDAYEKLVARDPALVSLTLLEALMPPADASWRLADGRRVMVAVTSAPAFRLDAQANALEGVERTIEESLSVDAPALFSGAGVFGVMLRDTIRREATWRSLWASLAIGLVLLLAYRRLAVLLQAALPLLTGLLTGAAAVSVVFGQVHGITLAFGFTLLGVAIDYPLHVLSRARYESAERALAATWPTLALGALSTGLAYLALMVGGARGMAQLGLFSAAGLAGALATTRWLLPSLIRGGQEPSPDQPGSAPRLRATPVLVAAAAGLALAWATEDAPWWSSDLAALSPIPAEQLATEGRLREATGAPSIRYLVALRAPDLQLVLRESQELNPVLDEAQGRGMIGGFGDVTPLLTAEPLQRTRQETIPDRVALNTRIAAVTAGSPFVPEAFGGFVDDAETSRALAPLTPADYADTELQGALGQYLYQAPGGEWTALATLHGDLDIPALATLLADRQPEARLVDLRTASESLVTDYRQRTGAVLGGVVLVIAGLLAWRLAGRRAAWTLGTVLGAVFLAAATLRWFAGPLDLYHLTGLLLVAGLGLDYALFLGKRDRAASRHAVSACAASTIAAFGVLSASSIPALHSLGSAVALGAAICFASAWLGSRPG